MSERPRISVAIPARDQRQRLADTLESIAASDFDLGQVEVVVVDDEVLSPTCTVDLARQIVRLAGTESYGLFHATAAGGCSWFEFAHAIFELSGVSVDLEIAAPGEFPYKAPRPAYSVLESRRLEQLGLSTMPAWRDGLQGHLEAIADV